MDIRPKTFRAVTDFIVGTERYIAGDEVPPGRTLRSLRGFGDRFVTASHAGDEVMPAPADVNGALRPSPNAATTAWLAYAAQLGLVLDEGTPRREVIAAVDAIESAAPVAVDNDATDPAASNPSAAGE